MGDPKRPLDPSGLKTVSLYERPSQVDESAFARPQRAGMSFAEWLDSLPEILAAKDLKEVARAIVSARKNRRPVIVGMGAHVIKVGLSPLLIGLLKEGIVTGLGMNGACLVHDFEVAAAGRTSEDVAAGLDHGQFGVTRETGEALNRAAARCLHEEIGLARAMGEHIQSGNFPHRDQSLLAACVELNVPVTAHVALGTDVVHLHPEADGAAIGKGSQRDFLIFSALVAELSGGVYLNLGSAVILPEVFLKALTLARNLGHSVKDFTTVNLDFIQHYRPGVNVVQRPVQSGGRGYRITGHHEIMVPLLAQAVMEMRKKV